ncbi:hypothetical protein C27AD_13150 [Salinisphaera hydrothermalis C27AD]
MLADNSLILRAGLAQVSPERPAPVRGFVASNSRVAAYPDAHFAFAAVGLGEVGHEHGLVRAPWRGLIVA